MDIRGFLIFLFLLYISILRLTRNKDPDIALSARVLISIFFLGTVVNFFLASKAISWFYFFVPLGMVIGIRNEIKKMSATEEEGDGEDDNEDGDGGEHGDGDEEADDEDEDEEEEENTEMPAKWRRLN